ncbi:mechanosensitive ion channel [Curvibacter sp. APW13]|uniref:mechanosensitive ion channel family protein n=1 Tax=Curvibacter sp. APW13 TaxID=3077236 RepID=UPI0028DF72A8|nr:mechanosensitive ion channel domain-containing protein [Curvibacter sp. APW13]MDT8992040.1 mechanosensitive ion channel [Curvibacter sp. APW13]
MSSRLPAPKPIDDLSAWLDSFAHPSALAELAVLAACVVLAWWLVRALRGANAPVSDSRSVWFGDRLIDGVLFPLLLLSLGYLARTVLDRYLDLAVFTVAIPVLLSLVAIRVGVKVLQVAFGAARWVKLLEQSISWMAWLAMVLWVTGLLPLLLGEMDQIAWKVGNSRLSLRNVLEGGLTAGLVLLLALWVSSAIESRLLRNATGGELSLRKAVSNAVRAILMFVGLLLALSAVGIDLTALSVLGGALGVGVGLGLQKLAANYVSGFVILAERSMRIGDNVKVDGFEGQITAINARYSIVRSPAGRESIVPNEMLITSRVENLSLADPSVYQSTAVTVAYDADVAVVQSLLVQAALSQPRVLRDPAPSAQLSAFGADGLEFTLVYWINDIENGQGNLRSEVNIAVLLALRSHGIEIPYPQRVVHSR